MNTSFKLLVAVLFVHTSGVFGQAMMGPYWLYDNHYLTDKYILNPAFAGSQYYPKAFISTQRMEMQLRDAPVIHIAGAHSRVGIKQNYTNEYRSDDRGARNAVGGLLFADNNGPFQSIGIKLDYAYTIPLNQKNSTLSFGLGGMLFTKRVRLDKYNSETNYDPLIAESMGNKVMIPDFNTGIVFTRDQFYAGFSVSQLLENSYNFSNFTYTPARVHRNFYLLTGYRFVYDKFEIEPFLAAGRNFAAGRPGNNGNFVDVNVECYLKPVVFVLSYRIDGFITTALMYRVEKFELGVRLELFSTNASYAHFSGIGLMASYNFLSSKVRR